MPSQSTSGGAQRAPRAPRAPAGKMQTAGAKLLLTASALAATLGGWAVLTAAEPRTSTAPQAVQPAAPQALVQPSVEPLSLDLPPLPTVVPLATPHAITLTELTKSASVPPPPVVQPVVFVQPTAIAQPTVAPAAPAVHLVLRSVTVPPPSQDRGGGGGGGGGAPAPATTSHSSR